MFYNDSTNKELKVKLRIPSVTNISFLSPTLILVCHQHRGERFGFHPYPNCTLTSTAANPYCSLTRKYTQSHPNLKRNSGLFCDVSLHVDGKKFRAHRSILAANSDFFLNLFRAAEDQTNFVLAGVPVRGFSVLLDFCYTNSFTLEPSNVTEVYRAASVLNFSHISSACEKGKHIWSIHHRPLGSRR